MAWTQVLNARCAKQLLFAAKEKCSLFKETSLLESTAQPS